MTDEASALFMRIAEQIIASVELCSRCHQHPRQANQRWCRHCRSEYMREWRARVRTRPCPSCRRDAA